MTGTIEDGVARPTWPRGFRINPCAVRPPAELIESYKGIPTAWISDCSGRSIGSIGLRSYHASLGSVMCGPAITVRVRPGDNLMIHKALELAQPGDVIVVDGGGDLTQALIGGNMRTTAVRKGLGGFVIDGAVRDLAEWIEDGMPCFAKGHTHRGPSKEGPGEINVPISCCGMAVNPGDLVIGDGDGVVTIAPADLTGLLPLLRKQAEFEATTKRGNAEGTTDPQRINRILRDKGCPV